jgi:hypothetical protein
MMKDGYRLPPPVLGLASAETREVRAKYIGQAVDVNGTISPGR